MKTLFLRSTLGGAMALAASAVHAQDSLLIQPSLPDDFDRGRNVSVYERPRPDYDPLGITAGSFLVRPRLQTDLGYDSNVYLTNANRTDDGFLAVQPSVRVDSDWSRHKVALRGAGNFKRYFSNPRRNETGFDFGGLGRIDATSELAFTAEAQHARIYESPLNGEADAPVTALSSYFRSMGSLRAEYRAGQARFFVVGDYTNLNFRPVQITPTTVLDQSTRDRGIARAIGQAEYAFTPSASAYVQLTYEDTDYDRATLTDGNPNRDSHAIRALVGINFDLAGVARGTLGAGYVQRNFRAAQYGTISGPSIEGKLELFPSELTTVTFSARRLIADSTVNNSNAFFDNRFSARVDHELLTNLILTADSEIAYIDYYRSTLHSWVYRVGGSGRYLVNRTVTLQGSLSYSSRTSSSASTIGSEFTQFRALLGVTLQR